MRVHYFQHVEFEGLANIAQWVIDKGYSLTGTKLYDSNYTLPSIQEFDLLIVLGGPMSVNDEDLYPWLEEERRCIEEAIAAGKHVLGICLGAQQIAKTLGADVKRSQHKEIGWHPIAFSDDFAGHPLVSGLNQAMTVFHWHGETFDIPQNAIRLASSKLCKNQAFLHQSNVLALQFHLEMDKQAVEKIVNACEDELMYAGEVPSKKEILQQVSQHHLGLSLYKLIDNWLGL